jgi:CHASE3 domain sensor protein
MKFLNKPAVQLGFASLLLIVAVILTFLMFGKVSEADIWRTHSLIVMTRANKTLATIMDAEADQRGYLLTGNKAYLKPYQDASESLFRELADLRQLTSDNSHQQHHVDELITLLNKRVSVMSQSIELRRHQPLREALEVDKEYPTNASNISIHAVINDFLEE